jgi:hypothetical protein
MQINVIHPYQVEFFWPTIERHIQASQDRGPTDMTTLDIYNQCRTDESWRLLIFEHFDGAAVIRAWDDRLHVVAIGGTFAKGWHVEFFEWLKRCARFFHLRFVTLGGRKGWTRLLRPLGFVPIGGPFLGVEIPSEVEP